MNRLRATVAGVLPCIASVSTLAPLQSASAQVQSAQTGPLIEEVLVSARKRDESSRDVPTTLQVFTGSDLARDGVRDFSQIQQSVSNFNFFSDRAARAVVALRGFGATTTTNLAPGVGIYVDGVYQPSTAFFNAPMVDLDRLEVLKGPQGTLFGRNAYAGAINVVTRRPGDDLEASAQAEFANGNTQRVFGSVSGPLVEEKLRGLVSGGFQQQDGFYKYSATGHYVDPNDYVIARTRLVLDATDHLTFDLTAQYFDLDTGGFRQHSVSGPNDHRENIALNEPQFEKAEFKDVWLNTTATFGPVDLVSVTSYSDQRNNSRLDGDFTSAMLIDSRRLSDRENWAEELRIQSNADGRVNWLVGAYYSEGEVLSDQLNVGGFFPLGPLRTLGHEDIENRAVFTDWSVALTERLELGAGLRYDEIEKEGDSANIRFTAGGPVRLNGAALNAKYDATQPKLSLRYALTADLNSYLTYAEGFREGGLNLNAPGTPVQSFDSDEIESYELGLKGLAAGGSVSFNAAAFYMEAPKYNATGVFANPLGGATLVTISVGGAESYGVEADALLRLNATWSINGALGYIKTKWTELRNSTSGARVGDPLQFTPEWSATLGARGEFPLSAEGLRLEMTASVSAKDETVMSYNTNAAPNVRDAYALFDMSIGIAGDRWRAVLFGRNLSDERYPEQYTSQAALASFGATSAVAQFNQPRMYGVRLDYRY